MPEKPQLDWINNLRIVAMFMVVILHTASPLIMAYGKVPDSYWLIADFYNALSRFGVPVFVMITGALLLHREYEVGDFLKKRLGRILAPFLFWSVVYVVYAWYNEDITFTADTWANTKIILHMLKYGSSYHLWYIYMLIGLYFFIPVIGKFVRHASEKEIRYFLLVWFGVMMIGQPYLKRFDPQVDLHYFAGYAGYLVLGHYLAFVKLPEKLNSSWLTGMFVGSVLIIVAGTFWVCKYYPNLSTLFYEPISPTIVLLSAGAFLLARVSFLKMSAAVKRARDLVGSYTFGIYLCHALILMLLDDPDYHLNINYKLCTPVLSIPLTALICFGLSFLLMHLLGKLPFGKWITG